MSIDYIVAKEDYDEYMEIIENQKQEIERLNKEIESWIKLINYNEIEDIPQYIEDLEVDNKSLKKENKEIDKENKRLNNIINELEEWLKEKQFERIDDVGIYALYETVLQKIQKIKGSDK